MREWPPRDGVPVLSCAALGNIPMVEVDDEPSIDR